MTAYRQARLLSLLLLVAGCGAKPAPVPSGEAAGTAAAQPAPTASARPFRVALLSPGPISDAGWNAAAYAGLLAIEREMGAGIAQLQTRTPPEFEAGFREYAAQGFDLVFGHGFEFQDAAAKVGAEYPETTFITTSGSTVRANVAAMVFRLEEATYLLGMLAARLAPEGKVGVIGGMEIPSVASTFLAFEAGAQAVRPEMPVLRAYLGNWEDVSAAREAALAQLRNGARFLFHNADAAGLGVFRAVEQARAEGSEVYAFGSNQDQAAAAPGAVLASAVLDIPTAFLVVAREVRDGRFEPRVIELGMKDGIVSLAFNPALEAAVPAEVRAQIEQTRLAIVGGTIEVPRGF